MNSPPARRGSLFTGAPAPRAVLDGGRAPRLVAGGAHLFRQRGNTHFLARPLDARARWLRVGPPVGPLLGRLVVVVLLVALGAAAQASGGVEISGGGGSGIHDFISPSVISASTPIFSRATSSTRRPPGRCVRCDAGRASDAAPRPAGRPGSARRSPALATTIRGRPAPRTRRRGALPGAAPAA